MLKKLLISFLAGLLILFSVAPNFLEAKAQATWYNQSPFEWYLKVYDKNASPPNEIFGERYTAAQVQWVFWSIPSVVLNMVVLGNTDLISCVLSGDISTCWDALKIGDFIKDILKFFHPSPSSDRSRSSNLAASPPANFLAIVGQNPISGVGYLKNLYFKTRLVSNVHAASFGAGAVSPVLVVWRAARNLSFFLITLVVIIFAFMIMFRVKINPQTVVSLQSSIPKIFIALILITFSYAIAGFLIDLMYVVVGLLALIITQSGLSNLTAGGLFADFTTNFNAMELLFIYWLWFVVFSLYSITGGNIASGIVSFFLFVFAVLTIIVMLWYSLKIIILMLKNFALIMIGVITGPIEILVGTVMPGTGFGSWLKKMLSYLAVYPLWAILFFLAFFFLAQGLPNWDWARNDFLESAPFNPATNLVTANTWDPPLTMGTIAGTDIVWLMISYFILIMTPKVTKMIQAAMQEKPFDTESAIGEAMGPLETAGKGAATLAVARNEKIRRDIAAASGKTLQPPPWWSRFLQSTIVKGR